MVDVHDVATAHIAAMLKPEAAGNRFIVASTQSYTYVEVADELRANGYGHLPLPTKLDSDFAFRPRYDSQKAKTLLGVEFKPVVQSISEMIEYLITNGIAVPGAALAASQ
jgi:nucleoside-diphosphate-sugar epimerase